jgi:hypothetical protein
MPAVPNTHREGKVIIHFVLDVNVRIKEIEAKQDPPALAAFLAASKTAPSDPRIGDKSSSLHLLRANL